MLDFSRLARLEKNKLSTDSPFLILFQLHHSQLEQDLYLVKNTENINWDGKTWIAFPIDVEDYEEDGKTLPALNLKISSVGGIVTTYLQQYGGLTDAKVTIYVVHEKLLNVAKAEMQYDFQITQTQYDENWATFTLGPSPELANRFPANKYLTDYCPFVCGDVRCGYAGTDKCKNNLESCLIPERFGGEPGIQSGR